MHRAFVTALVLVSWLTSGTAAGAQEEGAARETDPRAILNRMATHLAGLPAFVVTQLVAYDVVQPDGRTLEFGETRRVAVRRPDRARVDEEQRDGSLRGFRFDGRQIAVFDLDENVYAAVPKRGSLDAAIDYFLDDLGMRLPLAELLSTDLPKVVERDLRDVSLVDAAVLNGVPCHHLTARADSADLQVWVERGKAPLPRRVVITYKAEPGRPQFRADLTGWDLSPDLSDDFFEFEVAEGAERIPVSAPAETGPGR